MSVSKQTSSTFKDLTKKEIIEDNTYTSKFWLSSDAFMMFYRIENYVDRWDLGIMHNRNIYTAMVEKKGDTEESEESTLELSYTGPYLQYSKTLTDYENGLYYGIRIFYLSTTIPESKSYDLIESNDTYIQEYNDELKTFIYENNPKTSTGINLTFGLRW